MFRQAHTLLWFLFYPFSICFLKQLYWYLINRWYLIHISWCSGKESTYQCRRPRSDPWVWKIPLWKKWQYSQVFLPGKFHGHRNLEGCSPWGCKESDTTEWLSMHTIIPFTHLVYKLVVFSIFRVVWPAPGSICNSLQRNSTLISHHFSFPPKPPIPSQSLFYFMSLKIFLFWIFHMKGLSQYVELWNRALSLSIIYSSFIRVVALISTSFLFMAK